MGAIFGLNIIMAVCRRDPDLRVVGRDACAVHVCSYNQRKVTSRCSHPDAEEVATEGQVNVHVDIHPTPPEEDMPAEAVKPSIGTIRDREPRTATSTFTQLLSSENLIFNIAPLIQSWQSTTGHATSRGDLRLVVQPVVAVRDWSCNQSWQSAIGRATSRGELQLVVQSVVAICDWSCDYLRQFSCD